MKVVAVYPGEEAPIVVDLPWAAQLPVREALARLRYHSNFPFREPPKQWRPSPRPTIEAVVSGGPLVRLQSRRGTISRCLKNLSHDVGGVFYRDADLDHLFPHGDAIDWRECEVHGWPC